MPLPSFLLFLVLAFMAYRLAEMLVFDDAPFDIALRLRAWSGMYEMGETGPAPFANANRFQEFVGKILECVYCTGVWVSIFGAAVWGLMVAEMGLLPLVHALWLSPVVWLGLAGAQSVLEGIGGRKQ